MGEVRLGVQFEQVAQLVHVETVACGDDRAHEPLPRPEHEGFRDFVRVDAERLRFLAGRLRVEVRQQLVPNALALEQLRDFFGGGGHHDSCFRRQEPGPSARPLIEPRTSPQGLSRTGIGGCFRARRPANHPVGVKRGAGRCPTIRLLAESR
jgi:hypothetical protein